MRLTTISNPFQKHKCFVEFILFFRYKNRIFNISTNNNIKKSANEKKKNDSFLELSMYKPLKNALHKSNDVMMQKEAEQERFSRLLFKEIQFCYYENKWLFFNSLIVVIIEIFHRFYYFWVLLYVWYEAEKNQCESSHWK